MGKCEKVKDKIFRGTSDAIIAFEDIRWILLYLGFIERIRGSHHIFRKEGIEKKNKYATIRKQSQTISGEAGT